MDGSLFYFVGGALILAALVLSAIGIRGADSFPSGKAQMVGVLGLVAALVVATAAYAVANASEEQDKRNDEKAAEEAKAGDDVASAEQSAGDAGAAPAAQEPAGKPSPAGAPQGAPQSAVTLDVTSPDDGLTQFDPGELDAEAGTITLAYDNPSPVTHNIAIEDDEGQTIAQSDDVTAGSIEVSAPLTPGEYIYFCSIPGHRESGMEGTLIVK